MTSRPCDGCGEDVRIAGGIGDFWGRAGGSTGGINLELADGSEHFLCFDCVKKLPDEQEPTAADVEEL